MRYDVTFRYGQSSPWQYRQLTQGEFLTFKTILAGCEYVAIPRNTQPVRIAPTHPKRYGGQLEGHPIKEGWQDRWNGNCRQLEQMGTNPPCGVPILLPLSAVCHPPRLWPVRKGDIMRHWNYLVGDWSVGVVELPNGQWLGDMRLKAILDPCGVSSKQEVFSDVIDALAYVGYPVNILDIPAELL